MVPQKSCNKTLWLNGSHSPKVSFKPCRKQIIKNEVFSMGGSRYVPTQARSIALQPCQFRTSNVCRRTVYDQSKKLETAGPTYHDSFTHAQSPFAPVPEVLHTKAESATQQRVYKNFFHVWRVHSQTICAAGSGSSGTAAVSRNFGVPQACSKMVEVGRVQSETEYARFTILDAPDLAHQSAVRGCSCKSSSTRMLTYSTRLQPRLFRASTIRCTPPMKFQKAIKKLNAEIFQSDALQKYKERVVSLQQELKNSANLIFEEQSQLSLIHDIEDRRPISFIKEFDNIIALEKTCKENDKLLKVLQTGLLLNFDSTDSLLSEVKNIHTKNQDKANDASRLASLVYDYHGRMSIELSWLSQFVKTTQGFSSRFSAITSEIDDVQNHLSELIDIIDELASWKHPSEGYELQLCALRTIFSICQSTNRLIKESAFLVDVAADVCSLCMNLRSIHSEKSELLERFHHAELEVEHKGPQLEQAISELQLEVDRVNTLYVKKLSCIPNDKQRSDISSHIFQNVSGHGDFSWRFRKYNQKNIAPPVRTQGRGECSSVSTVSGTEWLYRRSYAIQIVMKGQVHEVKEFTIKLSHNHLQDIVTQIFERNEAQGKHKLVVCLDQMVEKGVVSESAYNHGDAKDEDFHRYRINGFEEINKAGFQDACDILETGKVLIGNMRITKDYYRLGPNDVYDIPPDAIFETNSSGQKISHCVVIVGFGMTPDGQGYYVYQNSYGPDWGLGGYGRVSSDSLKYLYSPTVGK